MAEESSSQNQCTAEQDHEVTQLRDTIAQMRQKFDHELEYQIQKIGVGLRNEALERIQMEQDACAAAIDNMESEMAESLAGQGRLQMAIQESLQETQVKDHDLGVLQKQYTLIEDQSLAIQREHGDLQQRFAQLSSHYDAIQCENERLQGHNAHLRQLLNTGQENYQALQSQNVQFQNQLVAKQKEQEMLEHRSRELKQLSEAFMKSTQTKEDERIVQLQDHNRNLNQEIAELQDQVKQLTKDGSEAPIETPIPPPTSSSYKTRKASRPTRWNAGLKPSNFRNVGFEDDSPGTRSVASNAAAAFDRQTRSANGIKNRKASKATKGTSARVLGNLASDSLEDYLGEMSLGGPKDQKAGRTAKKPSTRVSKNIPSNKLEDYLKTMSLGGDNGGKTDGGSSDRDQHMEGEGGAGGSTGKNPASEEEDEEL